MLLAVTFSMVWRGMDTESIVTRVRGVLVAMKSSAVRRVMAVSACVSTPPLLHPASTPQVCYLTPIRQTAPSPASCPALPCAPYPAIIHMCGCWCATCPPALRSPPLCLNSLPLNPQVWLLVCYLSPCTALPSTVS